MNWTTLDLHVRHDLTTEHPIGESRDGHSHALDSLPAIRLGQLQTVADLQVRKDRKYLVPLTQLARLLEHLQDQARVLEITSRRAFSYRSMYFDTPDLACYRATAHRRRRRLKVRIRHYLDTNDVVVEIKTRNGRGHNVKDRYPVSTLASAGQLEDAMPSLTEQLHHLRPSSRDLRPTLMTSYRRSTLLVSQPHPTETAPCRLTVDQDVQWQTPGGQVLELPDMAIIETKTSGQPGRPDRLLWADGYRPTPLSKYGTGMAALNPHLPANKWARTLSRHFTAAGHHAQNVRT